MDKELRYRDAVKITKGFYKGWYGHVEYKGNNMVGLVLVKKLKFWSVLWAIIKDHKELIEEDKIRKLTKKEDIIKIL